MKTILMIVSFLCLALTLVPSFLVFSGSLTLDENKNLVAIGTLGWFVTCPFWMKKKAT
jgi:hypothetical protein